LIWEKDLNKKLINELEDNYEKVTVEKMAMVCLLGTNMDQPGLLAKAAGALADGGVNIKSAGFALRKVNIQFLIAPEDFDRAIIALNSAMK
jgi:aspartate kinase